MKNITPFYLRNKLLRPYLAKCLGIFCHQCFLIDKMHVLDQEYDNCLPYVWCAWAFVLPLDFRPEYSLEIGIFLVSFILLIQWCLRQIINKKFRIENMTSCRSFFDKKRLYILYRPHCCNTMKVETIGGYRKIYSFTTLRFTWF